MSGAQDQDTVNTTEAINLGIEVSESGPPPPIRPPASPEAEPVSEAINRWLEQHCALLTGAVQAVVLFSGSQGTQLVARHPRSRPAAPWISELGSLSASKRERLVVQRTFSNGSTCHAVASPLTVHGLVVGSCVVVCESHRPTIDEVAALEQSISSFPMKPFFDPQSRAVEEQARIILDILHKATAQRSVEEAVTAASIALSAMLPCDRVAIGMSSGLELRILGSSDGFHNTAPELANDTVCAMHEAIDDQSTVVHPDPQSTGRLDAAHTRLCNRIELLAACTVPLPGGSGTIGAVIAMRDRTRPFSQREAALVETLARNLAPWLELQRLASEPWAQRLARHGREFWSTAGKGRYRLLAAVVLVVGGVFLAAPTRSEIAAPVKLEGAIQRIIAAPTDNYLRKVAVRPGDVVKAGQLLLEFDVEDLRLERDRLMAEQAGQEAAIGDAMSKQDAAALALHQAKLAEENAQLALLNQRLARGKVVAPFDAVVIEGDLTNALGAPTKRGDKLMVLAPAHEFRAIVEIDDSEIADVRDGQAGEMVLTAMPKTVLAMKVKRIVPLATVNEGRTYFEVEVELDGGKNGPSASSNELRPGMRGIAHLDNGRRPRGLVWFEEASAWCRFAWWRWVG